jgi:hypothetical protein
VWNTLPQGRTTENERKVKEHLNEKYNIEMLTSKNDFIEDEEMETSESKPMESLIYLMNLIKQSDNPRNLEEIREYNEAMRNYDD